MEQALSTYAQNGDAQALIQAVADFFKVSVSEKCHNYILGKADTDGILTLYPFAKSWKNHWTYQKLFRDYEQDIFPVLLIGSDGYGVEFWLDLESGVVISLHNDATFYEVAADTPGKNGTDFRRRFAKQNYLFDLPQLLHFQELTKEIVARKLKVLSDEYAIEWLNAALKALGKRSIKLSENASEFIYTRCRDFMDKAGWLSLKHRNERFKKMEKYALEAKAKSVDLRYCFLSKLPDMLFKGKDLRALNISYNHDLRLDERLAQLTDLEELILGPTEEEDLKYLFGLPKLKKIVIHESPEIAREPEFRRLCEAFPDAYIYPDPME